MQIQPHIRDIITKHSTCQQYQRRCCIAIRNTKQHSIPTKYMLAVSGIWIVLWQESYSKNYPFGGRGSEVHPIFNGCCSILYSFTCLSAIHESSIAMVWTFTVKENSWKKVYFSPFPHQSTKNIEKIGANYHSPPPPGPTPSVLALAPALGSAIQLKAAGMQPSRSHSDGWTKACRWQTLVISNHCSPYGFVQRACLVSSKTAENIL